MKTTLKIDLQKLFGTACKRNQISIRPSINMAQGNVSYFQNENNEAILQEFDGLLGFINMLDFKLTTKTKVEFHIEQPDLHVFYLMEGLSDFAIIDMESMKRMVVPPLRGRYFYLPAGKYTFIIPKRRTTIFNFYFRCSIFRDGNERPYQFLHPLIDAHRNAASTSSCSVDFRVGPRTRARIQYLLGKLKKGDLDNEKHILQELHELIKLSGEKIFEDNGLIIQSKKEAYSIREELAKKIKEEGQQFRLEDLSLIFGKSMQYLGRIFKKEFNQTLQQYRTTLLITHAREQLTLLQNVTQVAYACGFNNLQHFGKFFKKATGTSPAEHLKEQQE